MRFDSWKCLGVTFLCLFISLVFYSMACCFESNFLGVTSVCIALLGIGFACLSVIKELWPDSFLGQLFESVDTEEVSKIEPEEILR